MMDPFLRANSTSSVSCWRVAAAPVGLFGEQKKMMSVRGTCIRAAHGAAIEQATGRWELDQQGRWDRAQGQSSQAGRPASTKEDVQTLERSGKKSFSGRQVMY